jgi:hypothetical protein
MKSLLEDILDKRQTSIKDCARISLNNIETVSNVIIDGEKILMIPMRNLDTYNGLSLLTILGEYVERDLEEGIIVDEEFISKEYLQNLNINPKIRQVIKDKWVFFSSFFDRDIDNTVLLTVVSLLENFHLDCIRKCVACEKYFTVTKKKIFPFCRKCLKKATVYKWRKKDLERYNKYMRELQRRLKDKNHT